VEQEQVLLKEVFQQHHQDASLSFNIIKKARWGGGKVGGQGKQLGSPDLLRGIGIPHG